MGLAETDTLKPLFASAIAIKGDCEIESPPQNFSGNEPNMSNCGGEGMDSGGGDVRERELRTWRQEMRRLLATGQRLSAVEDRLSKAALSETERFVLQAIARAQAKQSREVDRYRDGLDFIDG